MKNLFLFLALSTTILFTSCEGDPGPPGEPGADFLAQVFEVNVDFQYIPSENIYETSFIQFPFEVYESDVALAYRYVETVDGLDVWTQLPQSVFYLDNTGDVYQYNFNHTYVDIQFTIEGNFDLTNIGVNPDPTIDQIFRIAVVPAEYANANLSMDELLQMMEMDASEIEKL